jgi:addiction module HigA family antidote
VGTKLDIIKGIHPGIILERELQKRRLSKGQFALSIYEYPQTLSAIIGGKRNMNTALALRIEQALGIEEGYFMTLQIFYEIKKEKQRQLPVSHPELSKFRPALFWDTKIERIDWDKQKRSVIERVFERGNISEKKEILNFYGHNVIKEILNTENTL